MRIALIFGWLSLAAVTVTAAAQQTTIVPQVRTKPTPAHDAKLLNLAGYEPVTKIARRLGRSERAVRCRLGALGISGKVTDGWSLRTLQATLRVRRPRLRRLIGMGILKVRDPRISASSLAVLCDKIS